MNSDAGFSNPPEAAQAQKRGSFGQFFGSHQKACLSSTDSPMLFDFLFSFNVFPAIIVHSKFEFYIVYTKKCTPCPADKLLV